MLVLEQEYGLMGLSCQLHLSICLKSSLSELSPDRAHSVNTHETFIIQGWYADRRPLIVMEIDQSTGRGIDWTLAVVWEQMGHVWQFHHPPYQVIYLVTLRLITVKCTSHIIIIFRPEGN